MKDLLEISCGLDVHKDKVVACTVLETTGNKITRDGYTWYEVNLAGAYDYGWIAGSLIGY